MSTDTVNVPEGGKMETLEAVRLLPRNRGGRELPSHALKTGAHPGTGMVDTRRTRQMLQPLASRRRRGDGVYVLTRCSHSLLERSLSDSAVPLGGLTQGNSHIHKYLGGGDITIKCLEL